MVHHTVSVGDPVLPRLYLKTVKTEKTRHKNIDNPVSQGLLRDI